jgi:transcriptional regulator with XRE-family HTH domain
VGGNFDLCGTLRRIRRLADLSQRELASRAALSASAVAHAEAGTRDLPVASLARAAALAGLRLALLDSEGREVSGMAPNSVRDHGGRRFPAHLDTVPSEERWWRYEHRFDRRRPSFTFDRSREGRDSARHVGDRPADHHEHRPGDSYAERAEARRRAYWQHRAEERERAFLAGELRGLDVPFPCACPGACDELDDRSGRPVHAPKCSCDCDLA